MAEETAWYKSSYSGAEGNACIETAHLTTHIGIRDSKDPTGPALLIPAAAWTDFLTLVQTGHIDFIDI